MKLKKFAAMMLAGVMAVSMLAGCSGKTNDNTEKPEIPSVTPAADVAAAINAELDENKDKISFTNNDNLETLMTDYYSNNKITMQYANDAGVNKLAREDALVSAVVSVLNANANANFWRGANVAHAANSYVTDDTNTKKVTNVEVYVLNGEYLNEDAALKIIGQYVDELYLPEEGTGAAAEKNYSYTGSVAAVKAETSGKDGSVWVVAVTVTQTPADK